MLSQVAGLQAASLFEIRESAALARYGAAAVCDDAHELLW